MEQIYALGISIIEFVQYWFQNSEHYLTWVNKVTNPYHAFEVLLPIISILDSVFAAQFLLCMAFGGWLNAVMKWWLLEDRPYWWVQDTTYYGHDRPRLRQFAGQTCETGPGSPSGHSTTVAMELMLLVMWISHVMNDRACYVSWWKWLLYPFCIVTLCSTMLARVFVAAHFPHQCLLGAAIGLFLAPLLCLYVSDPYIWGYGPHTRSRTARSVFWHVMCALTTIAIAVVTYYSLKLCGVDPQWSVHLAHQYCSHPDHIHVSTTPLFALVQSTASLLGWALCVTPALAKYRHYSRDRSLIVSALLTALVACSLRWYQRACKERACDTTSWYFYMTQFIIYSMKPVLFLRAVPALSRVGKMKIA